MSDKEKAFDLLVDKDINVRFLHYCFDKRKGLRIFNQNRNEEEKLCIEDFEFLRKVIYETR